VSRRQKKRQNVAAAFWADRRGETAGDPAREAQLEWDRLRAATRKLPQPAQSRAWRHIKATLREAIDNLPASSR
jgi:hypothetical protein